MQCEIWVAKKSEAKLCFSNNPYQTAALKGSSCRLNTAFLSGRSSAPLCGIISDLYVMNHVGLRFWHIVLSWESLAKGPNSLRCKNASRVVSFLKGHYPFSLHLTSKYRTQCLLGPMNHMCSPTSFPFVFSNVFLAGGEERNRRVVFKTIESSAFGSNWFFCLLSCFSGMIT